MISLKHDWKRELGSEDAQQSEVGQLSGSFQSNGRNTSRSQEIDGNSFCKNLVLQKERGDLLRQI